MEIDYIDSDETLDDDEALREAERLRILGELGYRIYNEEEDKADRKYERIRRLKLYYESIGGQFPGEVEEAEGEEAEGEEEKGAFFEDEPDSVRILKTCSSIDNEKPIQPELNPYPDFFEEQIDYRNIQLDSFDCMQDPGWVSFLKQSDPWSETIHKVKRLVNYEEIQLNEKELLGHISGMIMASGLDNFDRIPLTEAYALTKLQLSNRNISSIGILKHYKFLQYVDLSSNVIEDSHLLSHNLYLMVIDLSNNRLSEFVIQPAPWFLTYLNLSFNKFTDVPNFSDFWSLKHINLSHNFITKIEGITHFKYLLYLNLSHNQIFEIENIHDVPLKELDLSYNQIIGEGERLASDGYHCFNTIVTLEDLNLSNNQLERLNFLGCARLRKLDVSNNKLNSILAVNDFSNLNKLAELLVYGNEIMELPDIYRHLVYLLPRLERLNKEPVGISEKVNAFCMYGNNIYCEAIKNFSYDLIYGHVEPPPIGETAVEINGHPGLLALVGPILGELNNLISGLCKKYPKFLKNAKLHTTAPDNTIYFSPSFDSEIESYEGKLYYYITVEAFNKMWNDGKFLFVNHKRGFSFGLSASELEYDSRVCLIGLNLKQCYELKWHGLDPKCILVMPKSEKVHQSRVEAFEGKNISSTFSDSMFTCEIKDDPCQLNESDEISYSRSLHLLHASTDFYSPEGEEEDDGHSHEEESASGELEKEESRLFFRKYRSPGRNDLTGYDLSYLWWYDMKDMNERDLTDNSDFEQNMRNSASLLCGYEEMKNSIASRKQYLYAHNNCEFIVAFSSDDLDLCFKKITEICREIYSKMDRKEDSTNSDLKHFYLNSPLYKVLVESQIEEMADILKGKQKFNFPEFKPPLRTPTTLSSMSSLLLSQGLLDIQSEGISIETIPSFDLAENILEEENDYENWNKFRVGLPEENTNHVCPNDFKSIIEQKHKEKPLRNSKTSFKKPYSVIQGDSSNSSQF